MTVPLWAAELARAFWREAGFMEPFPRALRRATARALPVTVVLLARLRLDTAHDWLRRNGVACPCAQPDRPLRACLVACAGSGVVFLDGADPADEQRFSLAHELAHFLRDYWQPRRLASARLGDRVTEVFDGMRPPDVGERLGALLARVPLSWHVHLMERDARGRPASPAVATAEDDADRLAYELLAPAETILAEWDHGLSAEDRPALVQMLHAVYGLPVAQASDYAATLLTPRPTDPLLRRLRLTP